MELEEGFEGKLKIAEITLNEPRILAPQKSNSSILQAMLKLEEEIVKPEEDEDLGRSTQMMFCKRDI